MVRTNTMDCSPPRSAAKSIDGSLRASSRRNTPRTSDNWDIASPFPFRGLRSSNSQTNTPTGSKRVAIDSATENNNGDAPPFKSTPLRTTPLKMTPSKGTTHKIPVVIVDRVTTRLKELHKELKQDHAEMVALALSTTKAADTQARGGHDLFAQVKVNPVDKEIETAMRIKSKQHLKHRRDQREEYFPATCIKTSKDRVPRYKFHHVEIKKNILTPNTMLTFSPHVRDLNGNEEAEYNLWLSELADIDRKSGFEPLAREQKYILTKRAERAATLSQYIDYWLYELAIPKCDRRALISYLAQQELDNHETRDNDSTPSKTSISNTDLAIDPETYMAAELFNNAFQASFQDGLLPSKQTTLNDVLKIDPAIEALIEENPTAKEDTPYEDKLDEFGLVNSTLATYSDLGCLMCFSHSCDHGDYNKQNMKVAYSLGSCYGDLASELHHRLHLKASYQDSNTSERPPCDRQCYLLQGNQDTLERDKAWTEQEVALLRSVYATGQNSRVHTNPICMAATLLDRRCDQVHTKFKALSITLPQVTPRKAPVIKPLSWFDRYKKALIGDWQEHTITHAHQKRLIVDPCSHDGPCRPRVCGCADAGVLCEKLCGCTVENCAYKFTGCACQSLGKTCQTKQKDRPCICLQLYRECEPGLCGPCGSFDRANPDNANDEQLHSNGCQNVDLQRGKGKMVALGKSQLDGVGYGLFAVEDIAQDDFVIEYVGEIISHDEGVRREARRGDAFGEESSVSYVFTLLETEGLWVDAAMYGNLSRYINHASEQDSRGCNITPSIHYVNGEYRIKFTALRNITIGEELFFNYGENFPNLTKKLLDNKSGEGGATNSHKKSGRSRQQTNNIIDKVPERKRRAPPNARVVKPQKPLRVRRKGGPKRAISPLNKSTKRTRRVYEEQDAKDSTEDVGDGYSPEQDMIFAGDSIPESEGSEAARRHRQPSTNIERVVKRVKRRLRERGPETPSRRDGTGPRGKRGGARPGSGRPRKHPRPIAAAAAAPRTGRLSTNVRVQLESPMPSANRGESGSPTPTQRRLTRTTATIRDSDDDDDSASVSGGSDFGHQDDDRDDDRDDDDENIAGEEESEDGDVFVRNRRDRSTRAKRLPAKFRDEES